MSEHTKEPWKAWENDRGWQVSQDAGELSSWIAHMRDSTHPDHQHANARRICAAVNFCQDFSTEALEKVTLGEVAAKLRAAERALYEPGGTADPVSLANELHTLLAALTEDQE